MTLIIESEPAQLGIAQIQTDLPVSRSSDEVTWVLPSAGDKLTLVNRLAGFLSFLVGPSGHEAEVVIERLGQPVVLAEVSVVADVDGPACVVRRTTKTADLDLVKLLDQVPLEFRTVGGSRLLLAKPEPPTRVLAFNYSASGGTQRAKLGGQVFHGRLPVELSTSRPKNATNATNEPLGKYPDWTIVETPGPKDTFAGEFLARALPSGADRGPASLSFDPDSPPMKLLSARPKDVSYFREVCELRLEGRRIRWVDAWGVVQLDVTLRWVETE